jgi:hypothetical protein
MNFRGIVESLRIFKKDGISKEEALDYLEFDSDEYPDPEMLEQALEIAYGDN